MKTPLFIILLLFIATSCTVEKRLYNKGYNVQWRLNKKANNEKQQTPDYTYVESESEETDHNVTFEQAVEDEGRIETEILVDDEPIEAIIVSNESVQSLEVNTETDKPRKQQTNTRKQLKESDEPTTEKREGLALASLILGILGLSVLAIIFGLVQLNRINRNPDSYGGEKMARAGVILGSILMIISAALMAYLYGSIYIPILLLVSIAAFSVGIIQLVRKGREGRNNFGILLTIFGWLGVMFTTLLVIG